MKNNIYFVVIVMVFVSTTALFGGEIDLSGEYSGKVKTVINTNVPQEMLQKLAEEQQKQLMQSQGKHEINISIKVVVKKMDNDVEEGWKFIAESTQNGKNSKYEFSLNENNGQIYVVPAIDKRNFNDVSKLMLCAIFGAMIPTVEEFEISDSINLKPLPINTMPIMVTFEKIEIKKSTNNSYTLSCSDKKDLGKLMGNEKIKVFQDKDIKCELKLVSGKLIPIESKLAFSSKTQMQTVSNTIEIKRIVR